MSFLGGKSVSEVGNELADEIISKYPPDLEQKGGKGITEDRLSNILESVCGKAQSIARENKYGFFRKARLSNAFRWRLKDQGYSEEFIDVAIEGLVVAMTRSVKKTEL